MKKVLLFLFSIQLAIGSFATEKSIGSATIVTREQPGNVGLFEYTIEIKANEAFRLVDMPKINVPKGWKSYVMAFPQGRSCIKSTPTRFKVFVLYPANKRPFYPQQLSVSFSVQSLLDTARRSTLVAGGRVYFTPYNSVEIFSDQDFENSNRVWINEQSGVAVKRIYMPKNAIPVSNLNLATDTLGGRDMDDLEIKLVYMPGLAYCVPMKLTSDQMLVEDCDDGIDSIGTASQQMVDDLTNMLVNASNNPELATPLFGTQSVTSTAQLRIGKIKISFPKIYIHIKPVILPIPIITNTFTGTVSGRLTSSIINDVGVPVDIPLSGVFVSLKDKDKIIDELFGYTHTDAQGYYSISYSVTQSFLEGNEVELFIEIKSRNEKYDIDTKNQAILGKSYSQTDDVGSRGKNGGSSVKNINTSIAAFRVTSWATRCWEFSKNNGISLTKGLRILPHSQQSAFLEDGELGVSLSILNPTIRLESADCNDENTIYHEFGHFQMWNVQGFNFILIPTDPNQDGHYWSTENTSRIAWTEGWADAHCMIMDAAHWWEDNEYGCKSRNSRSANFLAKGALYEKRERWQTNNIDNINNGLWSEYFIACAIYDLWDGQGKGLPLSFPGRDKAGSPIIISVGYDDALNYDWQAVAGQKDDDVEFSFYDIVKPLITNGGVSGKIHHINEYYTALLNQFSNCTSKNNISRAFAANRVVFDIEVYERINGYGIMVAAGLGESKSVGISGKLVPSSIPVTYTDTYYLSYLQDTPNKTVDYKFFPLTQRAISDYVVYGHYPDKTTNLNINRSQGGNGNYVNATNGTLYTCGRAGMQIDQGTLALGAVDGSFSATIEVRDQGLIRIKRFGNLLVNKGSAIVVKSGGTLFIEAGATLNLAGKIIVEDGGYICIEDGVTLNYFNQYEFRVDAAAVMGKNAVWLLNSSNCLTYFCGTTVANADALNFDGIDDGVEIVNSPMLNLGNSPFTFEAYIKSNRISSGNIQVIMSKRNASETDGFMFGLWGDGHLWAQLRGAPNIGFDQGPNLLDGSCHHVALTRDASNMLRFYVDGALTYQTPAPVRDISSTGNLRIGRNNFSGIYFDGLIGEIRIWNVERTQAQLQAFMNQNIAAQTNLLALWDMKDGGQFVSDLSGNNNSGTLGLTSACEFNDPTWLTATSVACTGLSNFRVGNVSNDTEGGTSVTAYPNPFTRDLTVSFAGATRLVHVEVVNLEGQKVFTQQNWSSEQNLSFGAHLASGIYFVQVIDGNETKVFKVVKVL